MINEVLEPDSDDCAGKGAKVSNNQLVVVSRVADTQHKELISSIEQSRYAGLRVVVHMLDRELGSQVEHYSSSQALHR